MMDHTNYPHNTSNDYPILKFREELLLYFLSQKDTKYISGHFCFSEVAHHEYCNKFAFITVLRDPVERWISLYFFNRFKKDDHCKIEMNLETYIDSAFARSQGHEYVKFLGGADEYGDYTSQTAIDKAIRNLHKFAVVGTLEHLDNFVENFETRFRVRLEIERKNKNPKSASYKKSIITNQMEQRIRAICQPDITIYQYALENFIKPAF